MQRTAVRLKISHVGLVKKTPTPPPQSVAEAIRRKQEARQQATLARQRAEDKERVEAIRTCLLRRFGADVSIQPDEPLDFRQQIMQLLDGRIYEAAVTALKDFRSTTGRFRHFKRTFYRFARHLTKLYVDADVLYLRQVLRQAIDPELRKLQSMIAAFDRQVTDPKTYEALLSREIDKVLRYDVRKHAREAILHVENMLINFADKGQRLQHDKNATRVYVNCRLGSSARTGCFLVLELSANGLPEILAIQTHKEFNRSQKNKLTSHKVGLTSRGQRYSNTPPHLRH